MHPIQHQCLTGGSSALIPSWYTHAQWYISQTKYETIIKSCLELNSCIPLDLPTNFKLFRSKNGSKISIFGRVMKMYKMTTKIGHFQYFRSPISPKFANFRKKKILHVIKTLDRILKKYATNHDQSRLLLYSLTKFENLTRIYLELSGFLEKHKTYVQVH